MPAGPPTPDDAARRRQLRAVARRLHPDVGGDPVRYLEAVAAVEAEWARRRGVGQGPRPTAPLHPVEVRQAAAWIRVLRRVRRQVRRWRRERVVQRRVRTARVALRRLPDLGSLPNLARRLPNLPALPVPVRRRPPRRGRPLD